MKSIRVRSLFFLTALVAVAPLARAAEIPTPESVLGFKVGADRKLADWGQIVDYFRKLDAAAERVKIDGEGRTTLGKPFLAVVITSEKNMANLEAIRQANLRLADPRGLSDEEAAKLIATGKTIIAQNHGIHATEVAAPQTSMELAYLLATSQDPRILEILDKTVIIMLPGHNPDGTQMVVDWYKKSLGTPWEGQDVPFLYHHYNGHDNNRDWYMLTQAESQATVTLLYDRWKPQIVHDLHQMGSNAARIFAPPYVDPWEPSVDPSLIAATNTIGTYIAARLTAEGKAGVVVNAMYDGFSPARQYPVNHGGVRILTECASAKMATPIDLKFENLGVGIGYDAKKATWNFPAPWMGGTWRLRDIVDYQISASLALLEHGARNRDYWLQNFLAVNRRAIARTEPFAVVVSADQKDPITAAKLLEVMKWNAVEVQRAKAAFTADGKSYPAGSYVISMQQPSSGIAKSLMERQNYPDIRQYPGGPPQRPYDVTAHTLPLLLNVDVAAVKDPFSADLERVSETPIAKGGIVGQGSHFAFGHRNGDLMAAYRLMKAGVAVSWATEAFTSVGKSYAAGTLLIPATARSKALPVFMSLGVKAEGVRFKPAPKSLALKTPRVGLYQSYVASMDEGWTRFIFDKSLDLDYTSLHDKDIRGGNLRAKFDAIILPDESARQMIDGHPSGRMAEEFVGGLGAEGVAALKAFA
ncbi:MAG: M14 metallopeptidase family protein, partial [Vicinamibacteria bacterium]